MRKGTEYVKYRKLISKSNVHTQLCTNGLHVNGIMQLDYKVINSIISPDYILLSINLIIDTLSKIT